MNSSMDHDSGDDGVAVERESLKRITKDKNIIVFETVDERSAGDILVQYLSDKYDEYWLRSVCERNASVLSQLHGQMLKDNGVLMSTGYDILLLRETLNNVFLVSTGAVAYAGLCPYFRA